MIIFWYILKKYEYDAMLVTTFFSLSIGTRIKLFEQVSELSKEILKGKGFLEQDIRTTIRFRRRILCHVLCY
jgi:hypothetical protein